MLHESKCFSVFCYPEVVGRLFVVVDGFVEVGDVALVDFCDGLVVLGCNGEPAHVCVNVDALVQAADSLCSKKKRTKII